MLRSITLQLTDETLKRAQEIADQSGKTLEETLAGWIDRTATSPVLDYLSPDVEYPVYTPYDNYEAAQQLEEYLRSVRKERSSKNDNPT